MKPEDCAEVRGIALFSDMAEENFARLMRGAYVQNFPPFTQLFEQGDPADFLHVVVAGGVELYAVWSGRETTMYVAYPVSAFIVAASLKDAPLLMSARTLERSRLVLLPSQDVREVFRIDHDFARAVVDELAHCYRGALKDAKNVRLRNAQERFANYLLKRWRIEGGADTFTLPLEKRRLAAKLSMTPENLSRAIRALQPHGVEVDGAKVRLTDRAALEKLARPTPLIDDPHC